jgi:apolipoprotein N-acyltransferase
MLGLGALTALALPPVHFLPVLLLSFGLLGQTLNTTTSWKRAAWAGGLFGFGFYATGLYWLIHAVLIRAEEFWWFVPFPSLGCALILAPTVAAPAALSLLTPPGLRRLGAFAALWTLADMSRTFLFSGFTWNALGSCLAIPGVVGDILIQPAAWVGEDGLTLRACPAQHVSRCCVPARHGPCATVHAPLFWAAVSVPCWSGAYWALYVFIRSRPQGSRGQSS